MRYVVTIHAFPGLWTPVKSCTTREAAEAELADLQADGLPARIEEQEDQ